MSINEAVADALTDYAVAWRDSEGVACIKIATELRAAIEQHVAEAVAREREECALICDAEGREWDSDAVVTLKNYAEHCAAAIRARAEHEEAK